MTIQFNVDGNEAVTYGTPGTYIAGNDSDWTALTLTNSATAADPYVVSANFGILFRANGNYQEFSNGLVKYTSSSPAFADDATLHQIDAVISDLTGTGSGFNGTGTLVTLYADGSATPFASFSSALGQLPIFTNDQIAFNSDQIGAIDGLQISVVVPEPSSLIALCGLCGMGLVLAARKYRRA
jgi:hypothetical protein